MIFTVAMVRGQRTLVAHVSTWTAVLGRLDALAATRNPARPNTSVQTRIRAAIAGSDSGDAVQVTLPDDAARQVLRLAGVSA